MFLPIIQAGAAASMAASRNALTASHIVQTHLRRGGSLQGLSVVPTFLFHREPLAADTPAVTPARTFDSSAWTGRGA